MDFKAAIFDMDGTITDSMFIWEGLCSKFLEANGITPTKEIEEAVKAMGTTQSAEYFRREFNISMTNKEITDYFTKIVTDAYKTVVPKKLAIEYMENLKNKGIKMCVATATVRELSEPTLLRTGLMDYADFLITCDDVGKSKQSPDIYLKAAENLQLHPKEIMVFEDTFACANTAKNAGFKVTGVYDNASKERKDDLKHLCDRYIMDFSELLH